MSDVCRKPVSGRLRSRDFDGICEMDAAHEGSCGVRVGDRIMAPLPYATTGVASGGGPSPSITWPSYDNNLAQPAPDDARWDELRGGIIRDTPGPCFFVTHGEADTYSKLTRADWVSMMLGEHPVKDWTSVVRLVRLYLRVSYGGKKGRSAMRKLKREPRWRKDDPTMDAGIYAGSGGTK